AGDRQLAMESRHGSVVDHEVVRGMRADRAALGGLVPGRAGRGPRRHGDAEPPDRTAAAPIVDRLGPPQMIRHRRDDNPNHRACAYLSSSRVIMSHDGDASASVVAVPVPPLNENDELPLVRLTTSVFILHIAAFDAPSVQ